MKTGFPFRMQLLHNSAGFPSTSFRARLSLLFKVCIFLGRFLLLALRGVPECPARAFPKAATHTQSQRTLAHPLQGQGLEP